MQKQRFHLPLMTLCVLLLQSISFLEAAKQPPNILFIFSDDHALKAISSYGGPLAEIALTPNLDRLAREGMRFEHCLVTNSICAPSRAVVLTGKYSHLNGQLTNNGAFDGSQQTVPKLLQATGYQTAIVGKWHLKSEPTGFDHYEILRGQGSYYNPLLWTNGKDITHTGYTTDIITDQAIKWLEQRELSKPFFLMCQHKAPHGPWEPAIRDLEYLEDVTIPEPPTLFDDYEGRNPATGHQMGIAEHMGASRLLFKYRSNLTPEQKAALDTYFVPRNQALKQANLTGKERVQWNYQRYLKSYLKCVKAVDDNVGRLLEYLEANGLAENTVVIYSADQGFYLGEHGWFDKRWMYEESLHTPLLVRWPGVTSPGSVCELLVSNLDFAETFLGIANAPIPADMQGHSLVPILRGETPSDWRKLHYYHYYMGGAHGVPVQFGVTDGRYKLIRFPEEKWDSWEFYDLKKDPIEINNLYSNPEYGSQVRAMKDNIDQLQAEFQVTEIFDEKNRKKRNKQK